jgi:hypothetical protein
MFVGTWLSICIILREIFLYTVTLLNSRSIDNMNNYFIFTCTHFTSKICESKYSHLLYRNLPYKNLPKAKSAFHIPHQIKIKVSIYITRDQTVALWHNLGLSHFHDCHRIAILITALKHNCFYRRINYPNILFLARRSNAEADCRFLTCPIPTAHPDRLILTAWSTNKDCSISRQLRILMALSRSQWLDPDDERRLEFPTARDPYDTAWWDRPHGSMFDPKSIWRRVWVHRFRFGDCKRMSKFPFGDVPQNSYKIWEKIMIKTINKV